MFEPTVDATPHRLYRCERCQWQVFLDPMKLPANFTFRSGRGFLAGSAANQLPVRNARLADVEFADAVGRYFRKHQVVVPRRSCFDLTQYLDNPEANDFGEYDWLHLNLSGRGLLHIWPPRGDKADAVPYYRGFRDLGGDAANPSHTTAVLML